MEREKIVTKRVDHCFHELDRNGGDPFKLSMEMQTVVLIKVAQGIIDNGGFEYFCESNFPGNPKYSCFRDAYCRIGATRAAEQLEQAISMFPFENPEANQNGRTAFFRKGGSQASELIRLGDQLCGDESVWHLFEEYVIENIEDP